MATGDASKYDGMTPDEILRCLVTTDYLLDEANKVIALIPECPEHGRCLPHAAEWIEQAKAAMENRPQANAALENVRLRQRLRLAVDCIDITLANIAKQPTAFVAALIPGLRAIREQVAKGDA